MKNSDLQKMSTSFAWKSRLTNEAFWKFKGRGFETKKREIVFKWNNVLLFIKNIENYAMHEIGAFLVHGKSRYSFNSGIMNTQQCVL